MSANRVRIRAPRLGEHRPVAARRAVGGPVRLVIVADVRERAAMLAAAVTGIVTLLLAMVGLAVIW